MNRIRGVGVCVTGGDTVVAESASGDVGDRWTSDCLPERRLLEQACYF